MEPRPKVPRHPQLAGAPSLCINRNLSHAVSEENKAPFTRYNLLSNRLSNGFNNRFNNRLSNRLYNRFHNRLYRETGYKQAAHLR